MFYVTHRFTNLPTIPMDALCTSTIASLERYTVVLLCNDNSTTLCTAVLLCSLYYPLVLVREREYDYDEK